jgi:hypothetical protein
MSEGKGCKCGSSSAFECCCKGVDWRSKREIKLEEFAEWCNSDKFDSRELGIRATKALTNVSKEEACPICNQVGTHKMDCHHKEEVCV